MLQGLQAALPGAPLPEGVETRRAVRKLPAGAARTQQFVAANADEANSAVEIYFQLGPDRADDWLHLAVLAQVFEQPFYGELRTKQQLGCTSAAGSNRRSDPKHP
eukprot:1888966-Prymnesium_polylepis.1